MKRKPEREPVRGTTFPEGEDRSTPHPGRGARRR